VSTSLSFGHLNDPKLMMVFAVVAHSHRGQQSRSEPEKYQKVKSMGIGGDGRKTSAKVMAGRRLPFVN
jgi:hypothetical protein